MKKDRLSRLVLTPLVFFTQFLLLGFVMRLDPDPHHDGILYGAAVSVRNGGLPNRDAFAQYGPLVPELQGIWLRIFGPSLLGIRIQALIVFMLASIAIWYATKHYLSNSLALILSSTWALTIPSVLPWPTIYSTCFALGSLFLLIDIPRRQVREKGIPVFVAGGLISIGTFGRIHLVAIFILVSLLLLFTPILRNQGYFWLAGYLSTTSTILLYFMLRNSFNSFISQCITWPFGHYAGPIVNKSYIVGLFWYPAIAITFIFLLTLFSTKKYQKLPRYFAIFIPVVIFAFFFAVSKIERVGYLSLRNPRVLLIDFGRNMLNSLDYTAAFVMLATGMIMLFRFQYFNLMQKIAILFSVGIATQLYPLYDVIHLWMISPLLICSLMIVFDSLFKKISISTRNLGILCVGLSFALILQIFSFLSLDRIEFSSPSLRGMYAPKEFAKQLDSTLVNLERRVSPGNASFDCSNGIYAGAGGRYLASSPQFVNWGPKPELAKSGKLLFVCAIENKKIQSYLDSGYRIVFKDPLTLYGDTKPQGFWNILFSQLDN